MVAEIAIGQAVHEAVAEGIQGLGGSGLGNAVSGILVIKAGRREWGHSRNGSRASESRIVEVRKVHMELPEVQRARAWVDVHEEVRRTDGRRGRPIEVGRQEAGERAGKLKA